MIPPALDWLPEDKSSLKAFGLMLNKLWKILSTSLLPMFTASAPYVVTLTASSGSFTSASVTGRYTQFGKYVLLQVVITVVTAGTAGFPIITLPVPSARTQELFGREGLVNGKTFAATTNNPSSSQAILTNYDNSNPSVDGAVLYFNGWYEAL